MTVDMFLTKNTDTPHPLDCAVAGRADRCFLCERSATETLVVPVPGNSLVLSIGLCADHAGPNEEQCARLLMSAYETLTGWLVSFDEGETR